MALKKHKGGNNIVKKSGDDIPQNDLRHVSNLRELYARQRSKLRPVLSAVPQAFLLSLLRFDPLPLLF